MKVIVAGSRSISDLATVEASITASNFTITELVCGCAMGVDRTAQMWAVMNGIPYKEMPAEWDKYGRAAGPIRNRKMAEYADAAIIVWDGVSKGSRNMIKEIKDVKKLYFIDVVDLVAK